MLLLSDDEGDSVRQEADGIRAKIADLTRNAARLENLPSEVSSEEPLDCSDGAEAGKASQNLKCKALKQHSVLPPTSLGRVDVFLATEFHGGPFQSEENEYYARENDDESYAASLSVCETSLGARTGVRGAHSSGLGGTAAVVCAGGRRREEHRGDVGGGKQERMWVSTRVFTVG